jgi:hypothetical protein
MAFTMIATTSYAQTIRTGQDLHDGWMAAQRIQSGNESNVSLNEETLAFMFIGYVQGATDIAQDTKALLFPKGTSNGQLVAIVGKYLDNHPEEWNLKASSIVMRALRPIYGYKN